MTENLKPSSFKLKFFLVMLAATLMVVLFMLRMSSARKAEQTKACIFNLMQIDGATFSWAMENRKSGGDTPSLKDLIGADKYIKNPPVCPTGGRYVFGPISNGPSCSITDHKLPEREPRWHNKWNR